MLEDAALLKSLDARRRELGLSYELLSKRSGVSRPTVQRVLTGNHTEASFGQASWPLPSRLASRFVWIPRRTFAI